ncbi:hypothetical protein B0I35DRAFT_426509 [Stachybotrys elegans]|uniref:Uncharacterized protein n=1 Tax=Stachybotrys elegans TaxID=80388 RepID=A0A8K0STW3_9HYPO|nr:hypothetical protein B0I35DRAFT_426509 [Stachybotrys elegans]
MVLSQGNSHDSWWQLVALSHYGRTHTRCHLPFPQIFLTFLSPFAITNPSISDFLSFSCKTLFYTHQNIVCGFSARKIAVPIQFCGAFSTTHYQHSLFLPSLQSFVRTACHHHAERNPEPTISDMSNTLPAALRESVHQDDRSGIEERTDKDMVRFRQRVSHQYHPRKYRRVKSPGSLGGDVGKATKRPKEAPRIYQPLLSKTKGRIEEQFLKLIDGMIERSRDNTDWSSNRRDAMHKQDKSQASREAIISKKRTPLPSEPQDPPRKPGMPTIILTTPEGENQPESDLPRWWEWNEKKQSQAYRMDARAQWKEPKLLNPEWKPRKSLRRVSKRKRLRYHYKTASSDARQSAKRPVM